MEKRKKILIVTIFLAIISLLIISCIVLLNNNSNKNESVDIYVVPNDAKLILDKKGSISNGQHSISVGNHSLTASRSGFKTKTFNFIVQKNGLNILATSLDTNSSEGTRYLKDHEDEITKLQNFGSQDYEYTSNLIGNNYPIIKDLPENFSPMFRIDYGVSKKYPDDGLRKIAIYISSNTNADKQMAIGYIYELGYDPSDYEIIFEGL